MHIETRTEKDTLIVTVKGELDLVIAEKFKITVEEALERSRAKNLVLDLEGVSFIDSSGLGAILGRYKTVTGQHGSMSIVNPQAPVKKILELSGILRILTIHQDMTSALAAM